MSLKQLVSKYIDSAEQVLSSMSVAESSLPIEVRQINEVLDSARAYLEDAKYYREKEKFNVSLTSAAYCEGLLDALKLLGAVRFEWPKKEM